MSWLEGINLRTFRVKHILIKRFLRLTLCLIFKSPQNLSNVSLLHVLKKEHWSHPLVNPPIHTKLLKAYLLAGAWGRKNWRRPDRRPTSSVISICNQSLPKAFRSACLLSVRCSLVNFSWHSHGRSVDSSIGETRFSIRSSRKWVFSRVHSFHNVPNVILILF